MKKHHIGPAAAALLILILAGNVDDFGLAIAMSDTPRAPAASSFQTLNPQVTPSIAKPGQTFQFTVALKPAVSVNNLLVDLELRDSSNHSILKQTYTGQTFSAGLISSFVLNATIPADLSPGSYCLVTAVFDADWKTTHLWDGCSSALMVVDPSQASSLQARAGSLALTGVNLSGAEYNAGHANVRLYKDYVYPTNQEIDHFAGLGMRIIRMPFDLERVQPLRNGPLNSLELSEIGRVVQYAAQRNVAVILDPHNYGNMRDSDGTSHAIGSDPRIPVSAFADFWSRMAQAFSGKQNVIYGLMNEPNVQTASEWKSAAIAAVKAIRATGSQQKILIPGTQWTGAYSWVSSGNAAAWSGFHDPNFAFEVHQYLDADGSGTHDTCMPGVSAASLKSFTTWARANGVQGFLGEVGWSANTICMQEAADLMATLRANVDVWLGFTYWAAGPWTKTDLYSVEPQGFGRTLSEQPQMRILMMQ